MHVIVVLYNTTPKPHFTPCSRHRRGRAVFASVSRYRRPWNTDTTVSPSPTTHQDDPLCSGSRSHLPRSKWEQASCELVDGCCQRKCRSSVTPWYDIPGTTTYEACNRRFLLDETVVSATWLAPHLSSQQETVVMHPLCHSLVSSSNYISSEVEDVHLKKSNGLGHVLAVQRSEADDTNVASASV